MYTRRQSGLCVKDFDEGKKDYFPLKDLRGRKNYILFHLVTISEDAIGNLISLFGITYSS